MIETAKTAQVAKEMREYGIQILRISAGGRGSMMLQTDEYEGK